MDFCVITWGNQVYKMTEDQCDKFSTAYTFGTSKAIPLPDGTLIAVSDVRYVGSLEKAPTVKEQHFVPAEQKNLDKKKPNEYMELAGAVKNLFLRGEVTGVLDSAEYQKNAKKMWYDHIKRRPELNEKMESIRKMKHENWVRKTGLHKDNPQVKLPNRLDPGYDAMEREIINSKSFEDWYSKHYPQTK